MNKNMANKLARKLMASLLMLILLLTLGGCNSSQYQRFQTSFIGPFDTQTSIIAYTKSEAEFNRIADILYERIKELHKLYDIFNEYDGLNNLYTINKNAGIAPVEASGEIISMLLVAREAYELSGGMVNVAMGSVLRIWHEYRMAGEARQLAMIKPTMRMSEDGTYAYMVLPRAELPTYEDLRKAFEVTSIEDLIIDEVLGTVFLRQPGMSLDVGSVAKGYAAGLVAETAREEGVTSALLNIGGHVTTIGSPLSGSRANWSIGIQNPEIDEAFGTTVDVVYFTDKTLSISGGYLRFLVVDDIAYNHIIDPQTLFPANRYKQVAVIHKDSALADIISTALFILPIEQGLELAEKYDAKVLWIDINGEWTATDSYHQISRTLQ
jgi:thiamine biosynthesis lipoprotein